MRIRGLLTKVLFLALLATKPAAHALEDTIFELEKPFEPGRLTMGAMGESAQTFELGPNYRGFLELSYGGAGKRDVR